MDLWVCKYCGFVGSPEDFKNKRNCLTCFAGQRKATYRKYNKGSKRKQAERQRTKDHIDKRRIYMREWHKSNPDKVAKYRSNDRNRDKKRDNVSSKKYYFLHRDKVLERRAQIRLDKRAERDFISAINLTYGGSK